MKGYFIKEGKYKIAYRQKAIVSKEDVKEKKEFDVEDSLALFFIKEELFVGSNNKEEKQEPVKESEPDPEEEDLTVSEEQEEIPEEEEESEEGIELE